MFQPAAVVCDEQTPGKEKGCLSAYLFEFSFIEYSGIIHKVDFTIAVTLHLKTLEL